MSLTKAIEAAREALLSAVESLELSRNKIEKIDSNSALPAFLEMEIADSKQALAALPPKPLTEEEIATMIRDMLIENVDDSSSVLNVVTYDIIRALKAANALYVEETP